eukprot:575893-Lingulodinium_polyedra.AAC.1
MAISKLRRYSTSCGTAPRGSRRYTLRGCGPARVHRLRNASSFWSTCLRTTSISNTSIAFARWKTRCRVA